MIDSVAHVIQVALTPVFLLSAIAALLNVFSTRLGRVSDRIDALSAQVEAAELGATTLEGAGHDDPAAQVRAARIAAQLAYLRRRSWHLDVAVATGAVAGALTCLAILLIFFGTLGNETVRAALFGTFGLAVVSTMASIAAFVAELLIASRGARRKAGERQASAEIRSGSPAGGQARA